MSMLRHIRVVEGGSMASAREGSDQPIGLIYDATSDSLHWMKARDRFQHYLDASVVARAEFDNANQTGRICHSVVYDPTYLCRYEQTFASHNVGLQREQWHSPGSIRVGDDIIASKKLVRTAFSHQRLRPQGLVYRLCAVVTRDQGQVVYPEAIRSRSQEPFAEAQRRLLPFLLPHLEKAMRRGSHLWRLAFLILDGCRLEAAAAGKRHINRNTVRSHRNRIYVKTKADRQAGLVCTL
jgi:hypothetical protein